MLINKYQTLNDFKKAHFKPVWWPRTHMRCLFLILLFVDFLLLFLFYFIFVFILFPFCFHLVHFHLLFL